MAQLNIKLQKQKEKFLKCKDSLLTILFLFVFSNGFSQVSTCYSLFNHEYCIEHFDSFSIEYNVHKSDSVDIFILNSKCNNTNYLFKKCDLKKCNQLNIDSNFITISKIETLILDTLINLSDKRSYYLFKYQLHYKFIDSNSEDSFVFFSSADANSLIGMDKKIKVYFKKLDSEFLFFWNFVNYVEFRENKGFEFIDYAIFSSLR